MRGIRYRLSAIPAACSNNSGPPMSFDTGGPFRIGTGGDADSR